MEEDILTLKSQIKYLRQKVYTLERKKDFKKEYEEIKSKYQIVKDLRIKLAISLSEERRKNEQYEMMIEYYESIINQLIFH
ncbi:hypothetical protein KM1_084800 [Entamoeba histolytica HM-3:IMSS]|uniref:Uncharacterized protein n=1 Tax=Entamoeba histolytica HM-3:IMSS TaxID=885315 RepID=M7WXU8_ENTHI|nr:hypothetical protein KM1_084800 [Entamoeba histolytica HM-3:IMSS]